MTPTIVDEKMFRRAMSDLAKCVAVTTVLGPQGPTGCTTTSMMSLSIAPPSVLLALRTGGQTLRDVLYAKRFAINMLAVSQQPLVGRFAVGPPTERFCGVSHAIADGVPLVTGCATAIVCDLEQTIVALDHTLVIGTVRALHRQGDRPLVLVDGEAYTAVPLCLSLENK